MSQRRYFCTSFKPYKNLSVPLFYGLNIIQWMLKSSSSAFD